MGGARKRHRAVSESHRAEATPAGRRGLIADHGIVIAGTVVAAQTGVVAQARQVASGGITRVEDGRVHADRDALTVDLDGHTVTVDPLFLSPGRLHRRYQLCCSAPAEQALVQGSLR